MITQQKNEAFLGYNKLDGFVPTLVGNWVEVRGNANAHKEQLVNSETWNDIVNSAGEVSGGKNRLSQAEVMGTAEHQRVHFSVCNTSGQDQ